MKKLLALIMSLAVAVVLGMGTTGCTKKTEEKKVEKTTTETKEGKTETTKKTETETKSEKDKK